MNPLQRIEQLKRKSHSSDDIAILTELMILRARVEGEQVYLEALNDRLLWNRYPDSIQDQCIAHVGKNLGEAYQHTETRVYECSGIEHRIATFEHVRSGALLNLIPGGTYQMGGHELVEEQPIHTVAIEAMLLGCYEVRQSVWDRIGGQDERKWKGPDLPIDSVSWDDCKAWLKKAGAGLRLPSESEWEYACRAGTTMAFCFGKTVTPEQVNYNGNNLLSGATKGLYRQKTVEVGSLPYNAFGLHEVHGNLWEWCEDAWLGDYTEEPSSHQPHNLENSERVIRGGSWFLDALHCRSATRTGSEPDGRFDSQGFRICRSLE